MALRPSRVAGVVAGCAVIAGIAIPAAAAAPSANGAGGDRVAVDGSTPSWARPSAKAGTVPTGQVRQVQVALALKDPRGAEALAKAVSTPGSAQFKKFLSSKDFTDRFAATQQTVDRVSQWLRAAGLTVGEVSPNRHFIDVTGNVGQLQAAFGVSLATFHHRTPDGRALTLAAPESAVSVPRAIRADVTAVLGLDDSARTVTTAQVTRRVPDGAVAAPRPAAAGDPNACARYWGEANNTRVPQKYPAGMQSNTNCGYTAPQMRAIYGLNAGNTGAGASVAIVGAYNSPTVVADANRAAQQFGGTPLAAGQYSAVLPPSYEDQNECAPDSWAAEQALDVQSIHEIAPAAKLTYYGAKSCKDLFTALNKAVADNKASVISNSWLFPGESSVPQASREQMNALGIQAAIQGQSIVFCSGDSGDNSAVNGRAEASFPASHPWVTAVGGTSVALDGANKVKFSTGWENSGNTLTGTTWTPQQDRDGRFAGGAGGGISMLFDAPDYQAGVVPGSVSRGKRAVPDISALADSFTGIAIGLTGSQGYFNYSSGGTSLAAPVIAALVANASQAQNVERFGFLNGALYAMKAGVTDVTPVKAGVWSPAMATFGHVSVPTTRGNYLIDFDSAPQSLQSRQGWDVVTGVGTPVSGFVTNLGK